PAPSQLGRGPRPAPRRSPRWRSHRLMTVRHPSVYSPPDGPPCESIRHASGQPHQPRAHWAQWSADRPIIGPRLTPRLPTRQSGSQDPAWYGGSPIVRPRAVHDRGVLGVPLADSYFYSNAVQAQRRPRVEPWTPSFQSPGPRGAPRLRYRGAVQPKQSWPRPQPTG